MLSGYACLHSICMESVFMSEHRSLMKHGTVIYRTSSIRRRLIIITGKPCLRGGCLSYAHPVFVSQLLDRGVNKVNWRSHELVLWSVILVSWPPWVFDLWRSWKHGHTLNLAVVMCVVGRCSSQTTEGYAKVLKLKDMCRVQPRFFDRCHHHNELVLKRNTLKCTGHTPFKMVS